MEATRTQPAITDKSQLIVHHYDAQNLDFRYESGDDKSAPHGTKQLTASVYALYDIYGPDCGKFPVHIYKHDDEKLSPYQDVESAIRTELSDATLTITITTCTNSGELICYIPDDLANSKIYSDSLVNGSGDGGYYTVTIPINVLNANVIPLVRYSDPETGIVPTDKVPAGIMERLFKFTMDTTGRIHLGDDFYIWTGEGTGGKSLCKFTQINTDVDNITFRFHMNTKSTQYETELDTVDRCDTHRLFPEVAGGRRAQMSDGRCKAFGCGFTGTEDEVKAHLKTSPECRYIENFAASHSKIAAKVTDSVVLDHTAFNNTQTFHTWRPKTIAKTHVLGTYKYNHSTKPSTKTYTCASALCDFTCDTENLLMEHYRLLGARGLAIDKYFSQHPERVLNTTEAENREYFKQLVKPGANQSPPTVLFRHGGSSHHQDTGTVDKYINQLRNPNIKCIKCRECKPNGIISPCGHIDNMCIGCRKITCKSNANAMYCLTCHARQPIKFLIEINADN